MAKGINAMTGSAVGACSRPAGAYYGPRRAGTAILAGLWAARAVRGWLALILLSGALALPVLPVHADATDALFEAAAVGTASEVKAALSAGADPDARAEKGVTPLHLAAGNNANPSVIKALIEGGANPDARAEDGSTPLHLAAMFNVNPSVPSVIAALIEGGADPDARTESGWTPLHVAALTAGLNVNPSVPSVIKALIEGGADPAARDDAGKVPFDYAKENEALKGTDAYWLLNEGRFE